MPWGRVYMNKTIASKKSEVGPAATIDYPPKLTANPNEAAKMLGIGHVQVRQLVRAGDLPTLPGRNINIPLIAIERYLERLGGEK